MAGEHAWLSSMITALDAGLTGVGVSGRYGLVGYGGGGAGNLGRTISVGGSSFGTAAQLATATSSLTTGGSSEDGYAGISYALTNYTFRSGAAVNIILVTDEDRDVLAGGLTSASILSALNAVGAKLNVVVDNSFACGANAALGATSTSGFRANGTGGFTTCSPRTIGTGAGTTTVDYVNLALATNGAAWNLNTLRNGGNDAVSFTAAFVDIKVGEVITTPTIPEPSTALLSMAGLAAFFVARRRRS